MMISSVQGENNYLPPSSLSVTFVARYISTIKSSQITKRYVARPDRNMLIKGHPNSNTPIKNRKNQASRLIRVRFLLSGRIIDC
jgi:hypothetical protein